MKITTSISSILLTLVCACSQVAAEPDAASSILNLSLQELLQLKVETGSLESTLASESLSAITIINRQDIALSSARNLATLLEAHVPGFLLMTHSEGDKLGLRGLIAAENYNLLLLVNGKNITNMVYEGVILEIDQWDLNDIEKVEVVRGPGSVTYGTGAIAGVINIITKNAATASPGISGGLRYLNEYNSQGAFIEYARTTDDSGLYFYTSYNATDGYSNPDYYALSPAESTDIRFVGKREIDARAPQPYLADALDRPQIKSHISFNYKNNFNIWARYTQSGQAHHFSTYANATTTDGTPWPDQIRRQPATRGFALSSNYSSTYSSQLSARYDLTYDTQEYIRYNVQNPDYAFDHVNNIRDYAFAQNRLAGSAIINYDWQDQWHIVTGYEFTQIDMAAPWGKSADHLWVREGLHIVSDIDTSEYLAYPDQSRRPTASNSVEVGNGITFLTHSHLWESTYKLSPQSKITYAHRYDLPDVAEPMYAPRISFTTRINAKNTLRISAQRAVRMMPLRAQYLFNEYFKGSSHNGQDYESLEGIQVNYTATVHNDTLLNINSYINKIKAVGFTGNDLQLLGDMKLAGLEVETKTSVGYSEFSFNHSWLHLISMDMTEELKTGSNRNNISYSDYYYQTRGAVPLTLESYGDDLNNWPNNITKFLFTHTFGESGFSSHMNARIIWDYNGSYDEMRMYQRAYDTLNTATLTQAELAEFNQQNSEFERERELLKKNNAYHLEYRLNASMSYKWQSSNKTRVTATLFAENLLGDRYRYYVSTGSSNYYPERLSFMYEPRTIGVRIKIELN